MDGMSGHSKWSKVKHQKATTDVVKSFAFTKASRGITVAVREGGGVTDPEMNFHLRLAVEKARAVNMPKDNIERAIERATGEGLAAIEQHVYEGYGHGGVAIMIEAATDNKQRTVSQVKNTLERAGGTLASPGAVGYLFTRVGLLTVAKGETTYETILASVIDAGGEDVLEMEDVFEVYTKYQDLASVRHKLEAAGVVIDNAVLILHPTTTVTATDEVRTKIEALVESLESLDDVQTVYTNMA